MTDRECAIINKAICYAIGVFELFVSCVYLALGSDVAFDYGILMAIITIGCAELFIKIPEE